MLLTISAMDATVGFAPLDIGAPDLSSSPSVAFSSSGSPFGEGLSLAGEILVSSGFTYPASALPGGSSGSRRGGGGPEGLRGASPALRLPENGLIKIN